MSRLTVADPRPALRLLYQALASTLDRLEAAPGRLVMSPRPLLAGQIVAGASEFAISLGSPPTSRPNTGGRLLRRTYGGYVSVHFDLSTNPGDGTDEDALIVAVLERAGALFQSHASAPGVAFAAIDGLDSDLFVNTLPAEEKTGAAVLTLSVNFNLTLDLKVDYV